MAGKLLADADFFIALYKRNDSNHERALKLLEKVDEESGSLALSMLAYSETATVLSQRVDRVVARNFMSDLESSGVRIIQTTNEFFSKTKEIFRAQRSKNVSFTDAGNIALMQTEGFDTLVSFDADYRKNGIQLFRA